jgi:hypothetical protein
MPPNRSSRMPVRSRSGRASTTPPPVMTRPILLLAIAVILDLLRAFFQLFWFFGPALAGFYCTTKVGDIAIVGSTLAKACIVGAALGGAALSEVTAPIGVIMADSIGLMAFLGLGIWIAVRTARIFKAISSAPLQFAAAFAVGEIPFLGAFPVFTFILWRLYGAQIRVEKAALKKWEEGQQQQRLLEQREQQQMQLMQAHAMQQVAANDAQYAQAVDAANDARYDEIPEELRAAA